MARLILRAPYYQPCSRVPSGATRGGYANYIATREGVEMLPRGGMVGYVGERRGSHGLFSDDGDPVNLAQIKEEMNEHPGNIWGLIFSLKQEDAERLSYNQAVSSMRTLRICILILPLLMWICVQRRKTEPSVWGLRWEECK